MDATKTTPPVQEQPHLYKVHINLQEPVHTCTRITLPVHVKILPHLYRNQPTITHSQNPWNLSVLSARPIKITNDRLLEVARQSKWPVKVDKGTFEKQE